MDFRITVVETRDDGHVITLSVGGIEFHRYLEEGIDAIRIAQETMGFLQCLGVSFRTRLDSENPDSIDPMP